MTVRVLSYPPVHDYVDRLHPTSATLVHRDQPWPALPDLYDPDWLASHAGDWDVVHLHFTWEQYPPQRFAEVLRTHRRAATPIVWTTHDLRNPHTQEAGRDLPYLELLADAADEVVTLTRGAAAEVAERFGREAEVIAHGPMFSGPAMRRWRRRRAELLEDRPDGTTRLLLHLRSVRSNVDWRTPCQVISELHRQGAPVVLDVLVEQDATAVDRIQQEAGPGVEVHPHPPMSFEQLTERLIATDALVLAYRWGTHSGMVETATDLAVPVVAGDVGYLREQAPIWTVPVCESGLDAAALTRQVSRIVDGDRPPQVGVDERDRALLAFRHDHEALYARCMMAG